MGTFQRSIALAKASWGLLRQDKHLVVLPIIAGYTVLAWRVFGGKAMDLRYD